MDPLHAQVLLLSIGMLCVCERVHQRGEAVGLCLQANALQDTVTEHCIMHVQVLSLSIDFYVRVFVRVYTSAEKVKDSATKQMYVYQSSGCDSFFTQPVGRKVGSFHLITLKGPKIWVVTEAAAPENKQAGKVANVAFFMDHHSCVLDTACLRSCGNLAAAMNAAHQSGHSSCGVAL